jgi:hypothetical protein
VVDALRMQELLEEEQGGPSTTLKVRCLVIPYSPMADHCTRIKLHVGWEFGRPGGSLQRSPNPSLTRPAAQRLTDVSTSSLSLSSSGVVTTFLDEGGASSLNADAR